MTKAKTLSVKIPFSGFYESMHSDEIDRAINMYFDKEGDGDNHVPDNFYYSFNKHGAIQAEYAKLYVERFCDWFESETKLPLTPQFEEMVSPREYNFTTDRLFALIPLKQLRAIRKYVPDDVLADHIISNHRSRSGFCSFYSDDLLTWKAKPLAQWDHNELATLIEAAMWLADADKYDYGYEVMEYSRCNGEIDNIVYPYIDAWAKENPVDCIEGHIKEFLDIPDTVWDDMSENEKEAKAEEYRTATYRDELTLDLFEGKTI